MSRVKMMVLLNDQGPKRDKDVALSEWETFACVEDADFEGLEIIRDHCNDEDPIIDHYDGINDHVDIVYTCQGKSFSILLEPDERDLLEEVKSFLGEAFAA
jgi:hypothetical protein